MKNQDYKNLEKEAREELNQFLQEFPHLQPLQKSLDEMLETVGDDPAERARVMTDLMLDVFNQELKPGIDILEVLSKQVKDKGAA